MNNTREELLVEVAILYYEENKTQSEIANALHISRPTISNLLKEAREKGIVRITIQSDNADTFKNKKLIEEYYSIQNVIIVNLNSGETENKIKIGQACADFLEGRISTYSSVGIGWGTTMYEVVKGASYIENLNLEIVPLMGGISIQDVKYHSNHLAFQLAEKYRADVYYFYAPAIAESHYLYNAFNSSEIINDIAEKGRGVELAIAGIGNPVESSTYKQLGYISEEERVLIKDSGAIGDILGSFFDVEGEVVSNDVSNRMFGMKLENLKEVKEVMVLATGNEKIPSMKALLSQNFIDHLIIDSNIAAALIADIK